MPFPVDAFYGGLSTGSFGDPLILRWQQFIGKVPILRGRRLMLMKWEESPMFECN